MPRLVHMVFSASGVTMMRQRPVPGPAPLRPAGRDGVLDAGGPDVMAKDLAEGVVSHLSDEADRAPRDARQAAVLAADPPETSVAGPRAA